VIMRNTAAAAVTITTAIMYGAHLTSCAQFASPATNSVQVSGSSPQVSQWVCSRLFG